MLSDDTQVGRLVAALSEADGKDVAISDLCVVVFGRYDPTNHRRWHQQLGKVVSKANGRLRHERIAPGAIVKRTYRLTRDEV